MAPGQQTIAEWNDWLVSAPPKNNSWRTWMPIVLPAGPGVISTVAGENGTAVFTEPRVATVVHAPSALLVTTVYCPVAELYELVRADPREMIPFAPTTAIAVPAAPGQMTARWNGMPELRPPPMFLVSMYTV